MTAPAPKAMLSRGELAEWLHRFGIGGKRLRKLLANGTIKAKYLPGCKRALYNPEQVQRDVLEDL